MTVLRYVRDRLVKEFRGDDDTATDLPVMIRIGEFDESSVDGLHGAIHNAIAKRQPLLPIILDSPGGDTTSLGAMIDLIDSTKDTLQFATIALGKAWSCGAILLSHGTPGFRYAAPHSTILIHEVTLTHTGGKTAEVEVDTRETARVNNKLFTVLGKNTGKSAKYFADEIKKRRNADWIITAQEAKKLNIVDYVGVPTYQVEIKVNHNFGLLK